MYEAREAYANALKARRTGVPSNLTNAATFTEVKPEFYADARILSESALETFDNLQVTHPPYGLVDYTGKAITTLEQGLNPWFRLTSALASTGHFVLEQAKPAMESCPYHEVLARTLGGTRVPLRPLDHDQRGLDTFRDVATPGGELNAPLFTSLIRRLPALQRLHGSLSEPEAFARNSVSLLREPLAHPQQWATAFVFSLGHLGELLSDRFLHDELARTYTTVEPFADGQERLAWAIPTSEFTIRQEVRVADRTRGSETDRTGEHVTAYPRGTKLRDIAVTESTIGCPGDQLARAMWNRVISVVVARGLWGI